MAGIFEAKGLFYKAGENGGGGGGNPHDLGFYATVTALQTAHPTGTAGDFALVGATDTFWVWDAETTAWVDSDRKGQVTSVNNQTGDVVVQETLVSGTNIKSINNNSVLGSGNLELSTYLTYPAGWTTTGTTKAFCDDIAADASAVAGKAYLGEVTFSDLPASMANAEIVAEVISGTTAANKIIKLTCSSGNTAPYFWQYTYWDNGVNVSGWKGFQPEIQTPTTAPTLVVANWSSSTQTVNVAGVTANNIVIVSPAPSSSAEYASCGVLCTAQGSGTLTFTCQTTPTNDLTVNVVIM